MTRAGLKGRCFLELKSVLLKVGYIEKWPKFAYLESKVPHLKFRVMRDRVYWLGITDAIKDSISGCKVCLTFSDRQQRKPYISDAQTSLWSRLSLDNFEFQGQYFLMILDISTKFFVVRLVSSLNTDCTIQTLTSVFSEHGMPTHI